MIFLYTMVLSLVVTSALTFKPQRIPQSRLYSHSTNGAERSASNAIRLALLIDGDNAESGLVMQYVEEAGR